MAFIEIIQKTAVYHAVNGDPALFHTSKTTKMVKVIYDLEHFVRMSTCCLARLPIGSSLLSLFFPLPLEVGPLNAARGLGAL